MEQPSADSQFSRMMREYVETVDADNKLYEDYSRRETLELIRERLRGILTGTLGHEVGCGCQCGMPWDAGKVAAIARELRETVREIDDLPVATGGTELGDIEDQRRKRQEAARLAAGDVD